MREDSGTDVSLELTTSEAGLSTIKIGATRLPLEKWSRALSVPIQKIFGFAGDWVEDTRHDLRDRRYVAYYVRRIERRVRAAEKIESLLKKRRIESPREPSDKFARIAREAIDVEDDGGLQQMWANALSNAMDPDKPIPDNELAQILQQLSELPAKVFLRLYSSKPFEGLEGHADTPGLFENKTGFIRGSAIARLNEIFGSDTSAAVDQLLRLYCITERGELYRDGVKIAVTGSGITNTPVEAVAVRLVPTEQGKALFKLVSRFAKKN